MSTPQDQGKSFGAYDPDESFHRAAVALQRATEEKNQVTLDEFQPFMMLFDANARVGISDDIIEEVSQQFSARFNRFNKITIYDRNPKDPEARVLMIVPPMFVRTTLVNELGDEAMHKMNSFTNALAGQSDPIFGRQQIATIRATQVAKQLISDKTIEEYATMTKVSAKKEPMSVADILSDME